MRRYLTVIAVVCGISLVVSPPNLKTEPAKGNVPPAGVTPIKTQDQLLVDISKHVGKDDRIGIAAKNLKTGDTFNLNPDNTFDSASTQKLLIVAYMYREASNNRFDLDQQLTVRRADVQDYGTGNLRYERMPQQLSYRELAKLMMKDSDNTAAHVLGQNLDDARIQAFADQVGLAHTSVADHSTTATDMLSLLEQIHRKQLIDPYLTDEMLSIMRDTRFEDRIPPKLPAGTVVSHKTGDAFDGGLHDIGIVEYQGTTYALALYSYNIALEELAEISHSIFAYMIR